MERLTCRHCGVTWQWEWEYCPECHKNFGGAVYPAKQTQEEIFRAREIQIQIARAFEGVQRGDGLTLHEADLEGMWTEEAGRKARLEDPELDWREIPDNKLERLCPLPFLDSEGWRFYIPAYMHWTLRTWRTSSSSSSDFTIYNLSPNFSPEKFGSLTQRQSKAVYEFLKFFVDFYGEQAANDAIKEYWGRFSGF